MTKIEAEYVKGRGVMWCGKHYSLRDLGRDFDIDRRVLARRFARGLTVEQALSRPSRKRKPVDARKRAETAGEHKYEGTLCVKHNSTIRYTANYRCMVCHAEDQEARRKK